MGHYASQCPLKKKDKDEKHDSKVAVAKIEEVEFAMSAHASLLRFCVFGVASIVL